MMMVLTKNRSMIMVTAQERVYSKKHKKKVLVSQQHLFNI